MLVHIKLPTIGASILCSELLLFMQLKLVKNTHPLPWPVKRIKTVSHGNVIP